MLKRLFLASAIALGGSLAFAPTAKADNPTVDVPFNGTVEFECEFGPVTAGIIVPDGFPSSVLTSLAPGGAPGLTDILCNGDAEIDVTAVTKLEGPAFTALDVIAVVNGNPELPVEAGVPTDLIVDLTVFSDGILPTGDYVYEVTLTAVP